MTHYQNVCSNLLANSNWRQFQNFPSMENIFTKIITRFQVTVLIGIKTVMMVGCDFHHYNKMRKSQSPWLCFMDLWAFLGPHFEDHGSRWFVLMSFQNCVLRCVLSPGGCINAWVWAPHHFMILFLKHFCLTHGLGHPCTTSIWLVNLR